MVLYGQTRSNEVRFNHQVCDNPKLKTNEEIIFINIDNPDKYYDTSK